MPYKPEGHNTACPYLIVDGARATIDFLIATFGAVSLYEVADEAGGLRHAEVRIEDSIVMLADAIEGWPAIHGHVHVYVADVDATFARALGAGGASVQEPVRRDDPDKRGGVRDAGGTTWWIGQRMEG